MNPIVFGGAPLTFLINSLSYLFIYFIFTVAYL